MERVMFRISGVSKREGARSRALLGLAAVLLLAAPPSRAESSAHADEPNVAVEDAKPGCRVRGTFRAPVSQSIAWEVLTDYDHIDKFVSSMRESRVERRTKDSLLVRQDAISSFFIVHHRVQVLLDVQENPTSRIAFHDVLRKDFRTYTGGWQVATDSTQTMVTYELTAEPSISVPRRVCRGMLRGVARDLLSQVRAEMMRRAHRPEE